MELGNESRMAERLPAMVAAAVARRHPEVGRYDLRWRQRLALGLMYGGTDVGACYLRGGAMWGAH